MTLFRRRIAKISTKIPREMKEKFIHRGTRQKFSCLDPPQVPRKTRMLVQFLFGSTSAEQLCSYQTGSDT